MNWRANTTTLIGMTPNIQINWEEDSGDRVSFPIGLGSIGMIKIGTLPVRWGIGV